MESRKEMEFREMRIRMHMVMRAIPRYKETLHVVCGPEPMEQQEHWAWNLALTMEREKQVNMHTRARFAELMDILEPGATVEDERWAWESARSIAEQEVPHVLWMEPPQFNKDCAPAPVMDNVTSPGKVPEGPEESAVQCGDNVPQEMLECHGEGGDSILTKEPEEADTRHTGECDVVQGDCVPQKVPQEMWGCYGEGGDSCITTELQEADIGDTSGPAEPNPVDCGEPELTTDAGLCESLGIVTWSASLDSPNELMEEGPDQEVSSDLTPLPSTVSAVSTSIWDCQEVEGPGSDVLASDVTEVRAFVEDDAAGIPAPGAPSPNTEWNKIEDRESTTVEEGFLEEQAWDGGQDIGPKIISEPRDGETQEPVASLSLWSITDCTSASISPVHKYFGLPQDLPRPGISNRDVWHALFLGGGLDEPELPNPVGQDVLCRKVGGWLTRGLRMYVNVMDFSNPPLDYRDFIFWAGLSWRPPDQAS